jgi:hypothetical protein
MKNNCQQIQEQILSCNGDFTAAIEEHCADCKNCRQTKQNWELLAVTKVRPKITLTNDFAIIRAAQRFSRSQRIQVAIRRGLGYAAATVSGIAAVYAVMFNIASSNISNNALRKAWHWDSFEEKVFVLDTAAEISRQDITIGTPKDDALNKFIEKEIIVEQI